MDAAKDVLARGAVDSVWIDGFVLVALALFGRYELVTARAGNQRWIFQHSLETLELGPVGVGSSTILHQQGFPYEIYR